MRLSPRLSLIDIFFLAGAVSMVLSAAVFPAKICRAGTASTSVTIVQVCGTGYRDPGEACDPPDFGGLTCADYGFNSGDLTCAPDCSAILTGLCSTCGNNLKEGYEQCDGSDFGSSTCATFGYNSGTLSCAPSCNVIITGCSSVGLTEPGTSGSQGGGSAGGSRPTGWQPGSLEAPKTTEVVVIGKAYPNSDVNILVDGKVIGIVKSDSKADFTFRTDTIPAGVVGMGLWAEDERGRKSALLTITFRVVSGAVTTVSGAYLAPSIDIDKPIVAKGEALKIFGQTVPDSQVVVNVASDNPIDTQTKSTSKGDWLIDFDTSPLASEQYHITKASFELRSGGNVIKSGFSKAMNFYVGKIGSTGETCPGADLNKDGKVNLVDFSILLFYWGTDNACADQNHNGKVDLIDFSIMLYYWTG